MSNTSTSIELLISTLDLTQKVMGRYLFPIICILGNIGSILNIFILTQRVYRQNSCSYYILSSSIINLINVNNSILLRLLAAGFDIDPTKTSLIFCRFRQYIYHMTTLLSRIYIVLALADRWTMTSSNVYRRRFNQIKLAKTICIFVAITICILSIHVPLNLDLIDGQCMISSLTYARFYNIYDTILTGLLTPITMITFGFFAIRNLKHGRQQVHHHLQIPVNNSSTKRIHRHSREYDILIMILVQLAVYLFTCIPLPIYLIYITITMNSTKYRTHLAIDRFLFLIVYILSNINFSATFYIYILTARTFREDLKQRFVDKCFYRYYSNKRSRTNNIFVL